MSAIGTKLTYRVALHMSELTQSGHRTQIHEALFTGTKLPIVFGSLAVVQGENPCGVQLR